MIARANPVLLERKEVGEGERERERERAREVPLGYLLFISHVHLSENTLFRLPYTQIHIWSSFFYLFSM